MRDAHAAGLRSTAGCADGWDTVGGTLGARAAAPSAHIVGGVVAWARVGDLDDDGRIWVAAHAVPV